MGGFLEIKNLMINHQSFEGVRNVINIGHLSVEKGTCYGIVGESGAGKTVLALAIQKLLATPPGKYESGEIWVDGENIMDKTEKEMENIRGKKISMIFQDPLSALNPVFSIGFQMQNILMRQGVKKGAAKKRVIDMIKTVRLPDPENVALKYPHELSGGQRQRIIIGMALLCGADLIIADEPTRNLDVTIQAGILRLISDLQREFNVTILFIANNLSLVSTICSEMAILRNGEIVEHGTPEEIMTTPKHDYTKVLINAITPRKPEAAKDDPGDAEENIVEVSALKKYFPVKNEFMTKNNIFVKAVDDIDFSIKRGEVLGVVGESGCGKSTLVNTLLFLYPPTSGKVLFDGNEMFAMKRKDLRSARKNVQIVFQDPFWSLNPRWLIKDIIGEPIKIHKKLHAGDYLAAVQDMIEMVGLPRSSVYKYPHELSGGQKQRIAIARALSVQPKLVVLDEPTSAIDVLSQSQILELLNELKKQLKLTYIIISHDLGVVNYMATNIIVMYLGKIVEYGRADIIFNNPRHPYTEALFNAIPSPKIKSADELAVIKGEVPSAINPPAGCRFHPRCEYCLDVCKTNIPPMVDTDGRSVSCFRF